MLLRLSIFYAITIHIAACHAAEEPVEMEIPLAEIWALEMPGTKDIHGLDFGEPQPRQNVGWGTLEYQKSREDAINEMKLALAAKLPSEEAPRGFIFPWKPTVPMLRRVSDTLRTAKKYQILDFEIKEYPQGSDITLVFFSYPASYRIEIREIKRHEQTITVGYQAVPHHIADSTVHFALIPLKDLPAGTYQVNFEQLRMDNSFHKQGFMPMLREQERRLVCNDFSFRVWEPVEPDLTEPSANAIDIPLASIWGSGMPGTIDIQEINSDHDDVRESVLNAIRKAHSMRKIWDKAGKGFAVAGTGKQALEQVAMIVTGRKLTRSNFSPDEDINLFLFTRSGGTIVRLDRITRDGHQIRVEYHFGSRNDVGTPLTFALVPLGKLDKGRYSVEMIMKPPQPAPMNTFQAISPNHLETVLSQNFSFSVQ